MNDYRIKVSQSLFLKNNLVSFKILDDIGRQQLVKFFNNDEYKFG